MFRHVNADEWYASLSMSKQAEVVLSSLKMHDMVKAKCEADCDRGNHSSCWLQVAKRLKVTIQTHHHDGWLYIQRI